MTLLKLFEFFVEVLASFNYSVKLSLVMIDGISRLFLVFLVCWNILIEKLVLILNASLWVLIQSLWLLIFLLSIFSYNEKTKDQHKIIYWVKISKELKAVSSKDINKGENHQIYQTIKKLRNNQCFSNHSNGFSFLCF